ncbi:hypothetical protein K438DRAFT_2018974 [Mycena galopus ATCC 62051]|nr:hypothetical protein K438DRAFT_2018974 [Mycena galopus ATCC 62051]
MDSYPASTKKYQALSAERRALGAALTAVCALIDILRPLPRSDRLRRHHGILRLGTKYRVALRRRALQHLSSTHLTSLAAWDGMCGASSASNSTCTSSFASILAPPLLRSTPSQLEFRHHTPAAFLRAAAGLAGGGLTSLGVLEGIDYTGVHVELERGDKVLLLEAGGEGTSELLGFLWISTVCPGCACDGCGCGCRKYQGKHVGRRSRSQHQHQRRDAPLHGGPPRDALALGRAPPHRRVLGVASARGGARVRGFRRWCWYGCAWKWKWCERCGSECEWESVAGRKRRGDG